MEDKSKYEHSPAHMAVTQRDYTALKGIVAALPQLAKAGEVNTEAKSLDAEEDADAFSAVIDRRDVPGRETPLHLAVRLRDAISAEILMAAGADWSLQNENGWSALQEAVCTREKSIAMIIARYYQPLAWAKWCRRLPRIVASAARIRDFYMEITFNFESSVIPFVSRIAPSDTYRIWKRGSNLRADMTLSGFDGFRIQRSDQSILFLGEGYFWEGGDRSLPPGSLLVLSHKKKEIMNALEGADNQPSEAEVAREVAMMSKTNMYRPGIDVTQAELLPQLNWRRQERTDFVGAWKAKVYDMLHVSVSVKSRRVPGAMTDDELFAANGDDRIVDDAGHDEYNGMLTAEEREQLDSALRMGNPDSLEDDEEPDFQHSHETCNGVSFEPCESTVVSKEKKGWFGWSKKGSKNIGDSDDLNNHKKSSKLVSDDRKQRINESRSSSDFPREDTEDLKKSYHKNSKRKKKKGVASGSKNESEYKKGLRPVLWLTPDFPLKTEELLPLLDILANKVKAVRRLREVLTTKFPPGTFPVKIAIPIVPTIRVLVTFTKFAELQPMEEYLTPLSSPVHFEDASVKDLEGSSSWISWMKGSSGEQLSDSENNSFHDIDPFDIPPDYSWIDATEKKRRRKAKKAKNKKNKKPTGAKNPDHAKSSKENTD